MRTVGSMLMLAQRDAVADQHDVIVYLDAASNTVRIHWDRDNDRVQDAGEEGTDTHPGRRCRFRAPPAPSTPACIWRRRGRPEDDRRGAGSRLPTGGGSSSEAGGFYLTTLRALQTGGERFNDTRAIELERSTGRTDWFRFQGGAWQRGF